MRQQTPSKVQTHSSVPSISRASVASPVSIINVYERQRIYKPVTPPATVPRQPPVSTTDARDPAHLCTLFFAEKLGILEPIPLSGPARIDAQPPRRLPATPTRPLTRRSARGTGERETFPTRPWRMHRERRRTKRWSRV